MGVKPNFRLHSFFQKNKSHAKNKRHGKEKNGRNSSYQEKLMMRGEFDDSLISFPFSLWVTLIAHFILPGSGTTYRKCNGGRSVTLVPLFCVYDKWRETSLQVKTFSSIGIRMALSGIKLEVAYLIASQSNWTTKEINANFFVEGWRLKNGFTSSWQTAPGYSAVASQM